MCQWPQGKEKLALRDSSETNYPCITCCFFSHFSVSSGRKIKLWMSAWVKAWALSQGRKVASWKYLLWKSPRELLQGHRPSLLFQPQFPLQQKVGSLWCLDHRKELIIDEGYRSARKLLEDLTSKPHTKSDTVAYVCNPSPGEAETGRWQGLTGQATLAHMVSSGPVWCPDPKAMWIMLG